MTRRPVRCALLSLSLLTAACSNPMEQVALFDRQTRPAQTIRTAHVIRSDHGDLQLILDAPVIEQYTEPESKTIYPEGVTMTFYGRNREKTAFVYAGHAEQLDNQHLLVARDSVMIIDYRSHDTTYLKDLTWNTQQKRIYSDKPIRSKNGKRVTYGDSFESDENFEQPQILHQRGTVEWHDEN